MRKLDLVRAKEKQKAKKPQPIPQIADPQQIKAIDSVRESVTELIELIQSKEEYDYEKLATELNDISGKLDLEPHIQKLIEQLKPGDVSIKDYDKLLKAIKDSKTLPAKEFNKPLLSKSGSVSNSGVTRLVSGDLKVYAFTLSTTSTDEVVVKFQSGETDIWSLVLQSPKDIATGANLAINPPSYLFSCEKELNISLSRKADVKWAVSYYG